MGLSCRTSYVGVVTERGGFAHSDSVISGSFALLTPPDGANQRSLPMKKRNGITCRLQTYFVAIQGKNLTRKFILYI